MRDVSMPCKVCGSLRWKDYLGWSHIKAQESGLCSAMCMDKWQKELGRQGAKLIEVFSPKSLPDIQRIAYLISEQMKPEDDGTVFLGKGALLELKSKVYQEFGNNWNHSDPPSIMDIRSFRSAVLRYARQAEAYYEELSTLEGGA